MKKYKYQTLTREEKKKAKDEFFATERGKELKTRFNRIMVYSIVLLVFGIYLLIEAYVKKDSIAEYIYSGMLIVFAIFFFITRHTVLIRQVNTYIVTKKNKKK